MITDLTLGTAAQAALGFAAGAIVGVPYFAALWWNTRFFTSGLVGRAVALQIGRISVAVVALTLLAWLSITALTAGVFGFLAARPLVLRRFGEVR